MPAEQLVYTDRPRGKGLDPNLAGYQIKACSAGLSPEQRTLLQAVAMHYGDAVYRHAPRSAVERETAWRANTDSVASVPPDVLDAFPVIWSYDRLKEDVYALTRVCYRGFTHDGRTGNFVAHAVACAPAELLPLGGNPLALARAGVFLSEHPGDDTSLPPLPLPPSGADADASPLADAAVREQLPALLSALAGAPARPVVICLADWRRAAPLLEALLQALPPSARSRTTFVTYESDRRWTPSAGAASGRPADGEAPHALICHCGSDARAFELRPDEYKAAFAVFNFVERQFSELPPRPFAAFAAACIAQGRHNALKSFHELVEELGFGRDAGKWDELVPAADLHREGIQADPLVAAVAALARVCVDRSRADAALARLLPHVQRLAGAGRHDVLLRLAAHLGRLADAAEAQGRGPFRSELLGLAAAALRAGRARVAASLLRGGGAESDGLAVDLWRSAVASGAAPAAADADESAPLLDLLLDGVRAAEKLSDPPLADRLLVAAFALAETGGRAAELWRRIAEKAVKPRLAGEWSAEAARFAEELLGVLTPRGCPEGVAWVTRRLLESAPPAKDRLIERLLSAARACPDVADAEAAAKQLVDFARKHLADAAERAVVIGQIADALHRKPAFAPVFLEYRKEIEKDDKLPAAVRRGLAEKGATHVLAEDLRSLVSPWSEETPERLKSFSDAVLATRPKALDGVSADVARWPAAPEWLRLAAALLKLHGKGAAGPGIQALQCGVVRALPLAGAVEHQALVSLLPDRLPEAAAHSRLQALRLLCELLERPAGVAILEFPHGDPRWRSIVELPEADREQVLSACADSFSVTGVTTPAEAERLLEILETAGERSAARAAAVVAKMLRGRDKVTCVNAVMALAQAGLDGAPGRGALVRAVLERLEKGVRELFEAHLHGRFGRRRPVDEERLADFCAEAGLPLQTPSPRSAAAAGPRSRPASRETPEKPAEGFVGKMKSWFGKKEAE
jgi:hypothetical protein